MPCLIVKNQIEGAVGEIKQRDIALHRLDGAGAAQHLRTSTLNFAQINIQPDDHRRREIPPQQRQRYAGTASRIQPAPAASARARRATARMQHRFFDQVALPYPSAYEPSSKLCLGHPAGSRGGIHRHHVSIGAKSTNLGGSRFVRARGCSGFPVVIVNRFIAGGEKSRRKLASQHSRPAPTERRTKYAEEFFWRPRSFQ